METCKSCGAEVPEINLFCTNCGAQIATDEEIGLTVGDSRTGLGSNVAKPGLAHEKKILKGFEAKRTELEMELAENERKMEEFESLLTSMDEWSRSHTASYLWRTFNTMNSNLDRTQNILNEYESKIQGLTIPDPGVMIALRKRFHRRLLTTFTFVPAIMILFLWLPTLIAKIVGHPGWVQFLTGLVVSPLSIYAYGIGAILLIILLSLTSYYRGWSTFQAKVNRTLWDLEEVAQNAATVRSEQLRLKSVYPQLREWLEIMGHSLTRPWSVNKRWLETFSANIQRGSLPHSMHIAQTDESDGPAMMGMQRFAAERFMVRGWRSRVFDEQVDLIREQLGLNRDRLDVDLLDSDIAYAPNGPRALVRANITDEKILEKVALKQIDPLTLLVQREAIANTRPPVHEVKSDQMDALSDAESQLKEVAWDDFISMPLGGNSRLVSPFALHALSDSGQVSGHHSRAESFFIIPQRLESQVANEKPQNVRTYSESTNLPMDIVIRLDITGPIPKENLALLSFAVTTSIKGDEGGGSQPSSSRESGI